MVSFYAAALAFILAVGCSPTITTEKTLVLRRNKRDLLDLNEMVYEVTGRSGTDFIGYGNWCGVGGKGKPVDDIDRCCEMHDICYDVAHIDACASEKENIVYKIQYDWQLKSQEARCSFDMNECKNAVCNCDAKLANCLRNYIDTYNKSYKKEVSLQELVEEVQEITK